MDIITCPTAQVLHMPNRLVKVGNYRYYFTSNGRRATWRNRWVQLAGTGSTKYGRYYYFGSVAGRVEEKKGMQNVVVNNKFIGWIPVYKWW